MKIAIYIGKEGEDVDRSVERLVSELEAGGCCIYQVSADASLQPDTDMLLSVGGDGTFLSSSALACKAGVPVAGVNLGRLGFLSENRPEDVVRAVLTGEYTVENRTLLDVCDMGNGILPEEFRTALNEMTMVAEGYFAADCIRHINCRHNIEMPIADMVYAVLYEKASARKSMKALAAKLI